MMTVQISVHLKDKQTDTRNDQKYIGGSVECLVAFEVLPFRNDKDYRNQSENLPQFDPDVKANNLCQNLLRPHIKRLQARRKPKTVYESENKNHKQ